MKIQCEVCEKAEAKVLCCADEAVLCSNCDVKVHTANKLSQKHQRVSLLKHNAAASSSSSSSPSASQLPSCDICQERNGYFFCLEDRAILCSQCDMSIHMASPFSSSHQRFLTGGIKLALESSADNNSSTSESTCFEGRELSNTAYFPTATAEESRQAMTMDSSTGSGSGSGLAAAHLATAAPSYSWQLDDILGTEDFNYYEFSDMESSRIN